MNIHDWHRSGLKPAFATVEQWITDQLGYLGAEDEACFAIQLRPEKDPKGLAIRIIVASDKGLFDFTWERPEAIADRRLVGVHYRWHEVRGFRLTGETRINSETLKHENPRWELQMDVPEITLAGADESQALLDMWHECSSELDRVTGR